MFVCLFIVPSSFFLNISNNDYHHHQQLRFNQQSSFEKKIIFFVLPFLDGIQKQMKNINQPTKSLNIQIIKQSNETNTHTHYTWIFASFFSLFESLSSTQWISFSASLLLLFFPLNPFNPMIFSFFFFLIPLNWFRTKKKMKNVEIIIIIIKKVTYSNSNNFFSFAMCFSVLLFPKKLFPKLTD